MKALMMSFAMMMAAGAASAATMGLDSRGCPSGVGGAAERMQQTRCHQQQAQQGRHRMERSTFTVPRNKPERQAQPAPRKQPSASEQLQMMLNFGPSPRY